MARDHRIQTPAGDRLNFSCQNAKFQTGIGRGHPHRPSATLGSVIEGPLIGRPGNYSLWLEHVASTDDPGATDIYWLMWYDPRGLPTIPLSGVFNREQLGEMVRQLINFIPA